MLEMSCSFLVVLVVLAVVALGDSSQEILKVMKNTIKESKKNQESSLFT